MATTVDIYVDTDVSGGLGDGSSWANAYSSLYTAVNANAGDIVTADENHVYHCRASSGTIDDFGTNYAYVDSYVCDATHSVTISGDGSYVCKTTGGSYGPISLRGLSLNVNIKDIDFVTTSNNTSSIYIQPVTGASLAIVNVERCSFTSAYFAVYINYTNRATTCNVSFTNCVAASPYTYTVWVRYADVGDVHFYNNTLVGASTYVLVNPSTDVTAYNNLLFSDNCNIGFYNATGTGDYNATESANLRGANGVDLSSYTASQIFTDYANGDYSLCSGSPCIEAGDDLSATFTDDIDGETRTTPWDIGAYEYSTGGGAANDSLTSADITGSAHVIESPVLTQQQANVSLTATEISGSAPTVATAALTQSHGLTADEITASTPTVAPPTAGVNRVLASVEVVASTPTVATATVSQAHSLASSDITSGDATVATASLAQVHDLASVEVAASGPTVEQPGLGEAHDLVAVEVTAAAATVAAATLAQAHVLQAVEVDASTPTVEQATIGSTNELLAVEVTSGAATVATATIGQIHALDAVEIASGAATVAAATLSQACELIADNVTSGAATVDTAALSQLHVLLAAEIVAGVPFIDAVFSGDYYRTTFAGTAAKGGNVAMTSSISASYSGAVKINREEPL